LRKGNRILYSLHSLLANKGLSLPYEQRNLHLNHLLRERYRSLMNIAAPLAQNTSLRFVVLTYVVFQDVERFFLHKKDNQDNLYNLRLLLHIQIHFYYVYESSFGWQIAIFSSLSIKDIIGSNPIFCYL
jgi:hypothetical protein